MLNDRIGCQLIWTLHQLLSKNPDSRYQSAYGLKVDLLECQKRLSLAVSSMSDVSSEVG
jgi:hypothetical protein